MANLPPTHSNFDTWGTGWLPDRCKWMAGQLGLNPRDIEAFNIYYDDCPQQSWVFCRHKDAPLSQIRMIDLFGRLPVRMRDYVRHMMAIPGANSAASWGQDIFLRGDVGITVFIHDIGHNLDMHAYGGGYSAQNPFSKSALWLGELAKDSAVADSYAQTSQAENLAQDTVIALQDKVVPGGVGTVIPNSWSQIFHQYATVQWQLGDILIPGGTCVRRIANTAPAPTRRRRDLGPAPDVSPRSGGITIVPEAPKPATIVITHFDASGNAVGSETLTVKN